MVVLKNVPEGRSVLVVNGGSSSLKYALFSLEREPVELCRGALARSDPDDVAERIIQSVAESAESFPLAVVGHRIVHGGADLRESQVVTDQLVGQLTTLIPLAPNHLPDEIAIIQAMQRLRPDLLQMVSFDTAFHADLPQIAKRLAIPRAFADRGVRRYGFHGLSYTFLMDELRRRGGGAGAPQRVILAHLGNGSSLAAVKGGAAIDTSMGFTPLGGVVMSTRAGDLDPGVVTYIARVSGFDADRVEHELSHHAGLLGLSNRTGDMRELLEHEADDESCRIAVEIYCYEIKKRIGAYAAALSGLDVLVFSGGIGERAPVVRARICDGLGFLGIELDALRNAEHADTISTAGADVAVHVIPTNEEVVIARAAYQLLP